MEQMRTVGAVPAKIGPSRIMRILDKMPHPLVLLTSFAFIGMALTWVVPAGQFTRQLNPANNISMVVPGSFTFLETSNPQGLLDFLGSFWNGLIASGTFTVFMLLIGGSFGAISATGAIDAIIHKANRLAQHKQGMNKVIVAALCIFFGFCGSTFGMSAETLIFLPILVALCRNLKYDAVVAVALSLASCNLGYACATTNAYNIAIAQGIAELPLMSGIEFRLAWAIVSFAITVFYLLRYCDKIQKNPSASYVYDVDYSDLTADIEEDIPMTPQRIAAIVILLGAIGGVVYGAMFLNFGFKELSTLFISAAFLCGIICRMGINTFAEKFAAGAATMIIPLLLLGVARAFLILMQDGNIMDTIVNALFLPLAELPRSISAVLMVVCQALLNIFIPAASGQAAISMPIMVPLADLLTIHRQVAVFAFQIGDGVGNVIIPTFGVLMAALSMTRVPYGRWVAFIGPLAAIQYIMGMIFTAIAHAIGYGPF